MLISSKSPPFTDSAGVLDPPSCSSASVHLVSIPPLLIMKASSVSPIWSSAPYPPDEEPFLVGFVSEALFPLLLSHLRTRCRTGTGFGIGFVSEFGGFHLDRFSSTFTALPP